jgi:hypothetical protein
MLSFWDILKWILFVVLFFYLFSALFTGIIKLLSLLCVKLMGIKKSETNDEIETNN